MDLKDLMDNSGMEGVGEAAANLQAAEENKKKFARAKEELDETAEILKYSTREAIKLLPTISALAATLLVIATFNNNLIPLNNSVKILLTVLLAVILLGVWLMYWDLLNAQGNAYEYIGLIGKKIGADFGPNIKEAKKIKLFGILHLATLILFTASIVVVTFLIWKIDLLAMIRL